MWIESVLGHSFLACNLLWPCSLIETFDTELSGIHKQYSLNAFIEGFHFGGHTFGYFS